MDNHREGESWINADGNLCNANYVERNEFGKFIRPVDAPKPASDIQMAGRIIRSAKSQKRRAPIQSVGVPQSMSFGAGDALAGGGMFGASVAAGVNSFDFSAKGGPSAPIFPTSYGPNDPHSTSQNADDPRADTNEEELARRNRPFSFSSTNRPEEPPKTDLFSRLSRVDGSPLNLTTYAQTNQTSSIFNQPNPVPAHNIFGSLPSASQQQTSQPSQSMFGTTASNSQPTHNIFGGISSAPQQTTSQSSQSMFGTATSNSQPTHNIFGGISSAPQQTTTQPTHNIFGGISSAPQQTTTQPTHNIFGGVSSAPQQTASQPSQSIFGANYGFQPATSQTSQNLFGASQGFQPTTSKPSQTTFESTMPSSKPTDNIFGGASGSGNSPGFQEIGGQQPAQVSNPFAQLGTPAPAAENPSKNLFGQSPSKSLFEGITPAVSQSAPPSNHFGTSAPVAEKPSTNLFGQSPSKSLFEGITPAVSQSALPSYQFAHSGTPAPIARSSTDLFGKPSKPLFENAPQNSSADPPISQPATTIFGPFTSKLPSEAASQQSAPQTVRKNSSLFDRNAAAKNGASPSTVVADPTYEMKNSHIFGQTPDKTISKTLFSPMKTVDAPSTAEQPPPSGMFPTLPHPAPLTSSDALSKSESAKVVSTTDERSSPSKALVNSGPIAGADYNSIYTDMIGASSITDEHLAPFVPARFSDKQKNEFRAAYRLRSLNKAIEKLFATVPFATGLGNLIAYYTEKKLEILDRSSLPNPGSKRKYTDDGQENQNSGKRSRQDPPPKSNVLQPHTAQKRISPDDRDAEEGNINPTKQSRPVAASNPNSFKATQPRIQTQNSGNENLPQPSLNGDNAEALLDGLEHLEQQIQKTRQTLAEAPNAILRGRLQEDLNKLQDQLDAGLLALPSHQPRRRPTVPPVTSTPMSASPAASSMTSKRKADVQLTKDDYEKEEFKGRQTKTSGMNGDANGSSTSNLFKGLVDSPDISSRKVAPLKGTPSSKNGENRANPFGVLPAPKPASSTSPFAPLPGATSSKKDEPRANPFGGIPAPKSTINTLAPPSASNSNPFAPMPATEASNIFAPKPVLSTSLFAPTYASIVPSKLGVSAVSLNSPPSIPASPTSKPNAIQAPQFGSSVPGPPKFITPGTNLMSQFAAKAKDTEKELMLKAMEDDLDSDEDEETKEQWKADWRAKRKAKLEEIDRAGKAVRGFTPDLKGIGSDSTNSSKTGNRPAAAAMVESNQSATPFKSLFSQPTRPLSNSGFNSGTSTPGSVLDGPTLGQPSSNIFGHLTPEPMSDAQADEDSSSEGEGEEDSENRDPNYVPGDDSGSGPGTPVEETGPGIASAKKAPIGLQSHHINQVSDDSAVESGNSSGASTPSTGANLLDLVMKNNPTAVTNNLFRDDKENTQPNPQANNALAIPYNSSAAPADHTWNQETPIKFSSPSSTPNDNAIPKVNITGATPSKSPMPNIFPSFDSQNSTPKQAFGNLFGSVTPKAATLGVAGSTGFSFGGSPGSSLFPSTAGSGATSRATSPGNTTDGASDYDDPDAEKQEQLDLTAGGPGEEDELKLHEVRAKALKFVPGEDGSRGSFQPKGLGILRILRHEKTGATRILLRGDPGGNIILNKALLKQAYSANKKTISFSAVADDGGLETWMIQVKTEESAKELAAILDSNK